MRCRIGWKITLDREPRDVLGIEMGTTNNPEHRPREKADQTEQQQPDRGAPVSSTELFTQASESRPLTEGELQRLAGLSDIVLEIASRYTDLQVRREIVPFSPNGRSSSHTRDPLPATLYGVIPNANLPTSDVVEICLEQKGELWCTYTPHKIVSYDAGEILPQGAVLPFIPPSQGNPLAKLGDSPLAFLGALVPPSNIDERRTAGPTEQRDQNGQPFVVHGADTNDTTFIVRIVPEEGNLKLTVRAIGEKIYEIDLLGRTATLFPENLEEAIVAHALDIGPEVEAPRPRPLTAMDLEIASTVITAIRPLLEQYVEKLAT